LDNPFKDQKIDFKTIVKLLRTSNLFRGIQKEEEFRLKEKLN